MMFCYKHNTFYRGSKCQMCIDKKPPYKYSRNEIADPDEWARFCRLGWVR